MIQNRKWLSVIPAAALLVSMLFTWRSQGVHVVHAQGGRMIPEKRLGAATASYFPKEKHVTVQVTPLRVAGDLQNGIVLIPSFIVQGKKVVEPDLVNLQFIVDAPVGARPPLLRVRVFTEGRETVSGVPKLVSISKPVNGSVTRVLMFKVPYGKFLQILKGKEVKISVGHVEFNVTEEQLASMRDLQRMITERISFP
jgi:hypothetical protein